MSRELRVATFNTSFGAALAESNDDGAGFGAFLSRVDAVLLQELYPPHNDHRKTFESHGFMLFSAATTGLAIAVRSEEGGPQYIQGSHSDIELQRAGLLGRFVAKQYAGAVLEYGSHGVFSAKFMWDGAPVTLAAAHAPVVFAPHKRLPYLRLLASHIQGMDSDALILGADMNHYPRRTRADKAFIQNAGLSAVGPLPSWPSGYGGRLEEFFMRFGRVSLDEICHKGAVLSGEPSTIAVRGSDHFAVVAPFMVEPDEARPWGGYFGHPFPTFWDP